MVVGDSNEGVGVRDRRGDRVGFGGSVSGRDSPRPSGRRGSSGIGGKRMEVDGQEGGETSAGQLTNFSGNAAAGKDSAAEVEKDNATSGDTADDDDSRSSKRRKVPEETTTTSSPRMIRVDSMQDSILPLDIENLTQQLDYSVLTMPDHNEQLKDALHRDAEIIDKVETRLGINKCCEHGVKLSTIIKAKALRLNEAAVLDVLNGVIELYKSKFSVPSEASATRANQEDANGGRVLDFALVSKRFSSKILATCTLDWSTIPTPRGNASDAAAAARQPRGRGGINSLVASVPSRVLVATQDVIQSANEALGEDGTIATATMGDSQGALLDYRSFCNHLYKTCSQGPVSFWPMILDADPVHGFTNTTMALYALTHATIKGDAKFTIASTLAEHQQQQQQHVAENVKISVGCKTNACRTSRHVKMSKVLKMVKV